jgi:tartrate-resistant acid phosphatase type 5
MRKLLVLVACLVVAGVARGQTPAGELDFLVIGDWGRDGGGFQTKVATQMAAVAARRPEAFVISLGDNFYETGVKTVADKQFSTSFENVYSAPSLRVPWFVALGNHDWQGNPQAQIDYTRVNSRWHMPAHYFSVVQQIDDSTRAEFFFIDTTPFITEYQKEAKYARAAHAGTAPQLHWLDSALAASTAQWKIVAGHHPVYSASPKHGTTPELVRDLKPLLEKYHAQVYLSGHDHNLQDEHSGRVEYLISGGGSEAREAGHNVETRWSATSAGFVAVRLTSATLRADFISPAGKVLYTTTVPRG